MGDVERNVSRGWELGKLDQALFAREDDGGQRYLATGTNPAFPVGEDWRNVAITQKGATITVEVDGEVLTTFTDGPGSEGLGPWSDYLEQEVYNSGTIGLYTEDAHVQFKDVSVTQP